MERIQLINPERIRWCCEDGRITPEELASGVGIAQSTLEKVMEGESGLTFNQLRKLAEYFSRGVLFFLEAAPVRESRMRSPQFRTIANQKPNLSHEIKALIQRVEFHRELYLSLREDLDEEDVPRFDPPEVPRENPKRAAAITREWLGLEGNQEFGSYRAAVESKGVLVFRSMGYIGAWRIPDESQVVGFSLYDRACPVIVIKKQENESRQNFTLMHELGHVLLHRKSFIDEEADLYSQGGRERAANAFAGNLFVPDHFLHQISDDSRPENVAEYRGWLRHYTRQWGIGTEVVLRRLLDVGRLDQSQYRAYRYWRDQQPPPVHSSP